MKPTVLFITAIIMVIIGYDFFALYYWGYDSTISWTLYDESTRRPVISFAIGAVFGHIFWPNRKVVDVANK